MRTVYRPGRRPFLCIGLLVLVFILAACGANSTGGTGSSPTATPTPVKGYGTSHGCPSDNVVNTAPARANVTILPTNANTTITAHNGDVIEVRLPFGQKWSGPVASQGVLELQQPYGYAMQSDSVCVWRFVAKGVGTTELVFHSRAICKPGEMCPQYITNLPFTVDVK